MMEMVKFSKYANEPIIDGEIDGKPFHPQFAIPYLDNNLSFSCYLS